MKARKLLGRTLFWFGLGVLTHDYAHALWEIGGYKEIISPQGGWIGLTLIILGWILCLESLKQHIKNSRKG